MLNNQKIDISTSFRAIFALVWPQMLMMYLLCVMNIAPIWAAGQMSAEVQAALGMSMQALFFLNVVCIAISAGATSVISQSVGAGRVARAHSYVLLALGLNFFLGVIISAFAYVFADFIFELLALNGEALRVAKQLWGILLFSVVFSYVFNTCVVLFRSFREVKTPLFITLCVCVVHLFFLFALSFGRFGFSQFGYIGIAWANLISQGFGAIMSLGLLRYFGHIRLSGFSLRWSVFALPYLSRVALHSGATSVVWQGGNLMLYTIVASLPMHATAALAGLSAGFRIESLLFMAGMAFHMSASVLVGNCLGAKKEAEAKRVAAYLIFGGAGLMSIVAGLIWPFMDALCAFITSDTLAAHYTKEYLIYNIASTPFSVASSVFAGVMIGAGAAHFNLLVFGLTFWVVRIPLGFVLGHLVLKDASGVFIAMLISQILQTAIVCYIFWRINWTKYKMK